MIEPMEIDIHHTSREDLIREVRKLEDGYTSYRDAYCKAEKERVALEKNLNMAIEALEMISRWKDAYPEDIFPPIGKNAYYLMCGNAGYSVDRVSAHVMRPSVKGYSELADKTLRKIGETK